VALWIVAGLALTVAALAWAAARRLSRRLDALTQSYWELRYEYTRLRSQMSRLDPAPPQDPATPQDEAPEPAAPPAVSFVPLSSMKKKS
jgi:hypothetical protein